MQSIQKQNIYQIAMIGIMAAIICILGPLSIPIGIVPISLTSIGIYLSVYILGWKNGTISYLVYLLIGLFGIPVFSGATGGPGKLLGPTGGYLIGFIFMALISGLFVEYFPQNKILITLGMLIGLLVTYGIGTIWLAYNLHITFLPALSIGVVKFIPGDLIKILIVIVISPIIKKQLMKANIL